MSHKVTISGTSQNPGAPVYLPIPQENEAIHEGSLHKTESDAISSCNMPK